MEPARQVPLTRGLFALVDHQDLDRVAGVKWVAKPIQRERGGWYAHRTVGGRTVYLHRYLLHAPAHLQVDHINGDGLDNRRANLRLCTASQNNLNRTNSNRTGYRGVEKRGERYRAALFQGGRQTVGLFDTAEEAAFAYDYAASAAYGEFAVLNFQRAA